MYITRGTIGESSFQYFLCFFVRYFCVLCNQMEMKTIKRKCVLELVQVVGCRVVCCSVLQCVAVCSIVWQRVAVRGSAWQRVAARGSVL